MTLIIKTLALFALVASLGAEPSRAQTSPIPLPGMTGAGEAAQTGTVTAQDSAKQTQALIDALKDDATRTRLVEALEQSVAADSAAAGQAGESVGRANLPAARDPDSPSIGDRVLESAPEVARDFIADQRTAWRKFRLTLRRLGGLSDIDPTEGLAILVTTLKLITVSFGLALFGRLALIPVFRRITRTAQESPTSRRLLLSLLLILLDLAVLTIASLATLAVAAWVVPPDTAGTLRQYHLYYSIAFFYAGVLAIAVGAALSPQTRALRPVPLGDSLARYWFGHLVAVIAVVTFGEIFIAQVVSELAGPVTANAVTMAFHVAAAIYLATLIVINRKGPPAWLATRVAADPENTRLAIVAMMARYWHYLAIAVVAWLLRGAIVSDDQALPMILQLVQILIGLSLAVMLIGYFNRRADRGVTVPEAIQRAIPNLAPRLDAFVPSFLRFLRYIVLLAWTGFAFQVLGLANPGHWIEARYGFDFAGAIVSLIIIVLACYAVWLAVTSWIDYRLTPTDEHTPTARQETLYALLRNAALVGILLLGLSYALASFGVSIAPLLASAGVVGLAIGFGSQKLVQDIINGLFIQFEGAINVGDVVELAGLIGVAEKLTIRSVSLRDVQGVLHIIPFSSVDSVSNHMRGYSYHVADISVAYGSDLDIAKDEMLAAYDDLAENFEWGSKLLGGVEWFGVQALGDNAVQLRIRLKTRPGEQWAVGRAYAERVKRRFDAAGVEIPFPQMRLWTGSGKTGAAKSPGRVAPDGLSPHGGLTDADASDGDGGDGPSR